MKKLFACISALAIAGSFLLAGCNQKDPLSTTSGVQADATKDTTVSIEGNTSGTEGNTVNEENLPDETIEAGSEDGFVLLPAELSLYGQINEDSPYLAAVIHNGNIDSFRLPFAGKTYVCVYDIGVSLKESNIMKNTFVKVATSSGFLYHFGIGSEVGAFTTIINNEVFDSGHVQFAPADSVNADGILMLKANEISCITAFEQTEDGGHKETAAGYIDTLLIQQGAPYTFLKVGEDTPIDYYVSTTLVADVELSKDLWDPVKDDINYSDFKNTIVVLNDADSLSSVDAVLGKEYDLNEVTFAQDLVAAKISELYGLNLKDKNVCFFLDSEYIAYRTTDSEGKRIQVVFDYFPGSSHYSNFTVTYDEFAASLPVENHFSYTDKEGNQYDYFANSSRIYIYKGKELTGVASVEGAGVPSTDGVLDVFFGLSALFGIKP